MEESAHGHAHAAHGTGVRWLDMSLALSAFVVSLASLWRLEAARDRIAIRVCYCSVFDECYMRDSDHREPVRIQACPAAAVPYTGD